MAAEVVVADSEGARRELLMELLKIRSNEAAALLGHVIRATTVFMAIVGALFKFALDANATPALRVGLAYFGIGFTLLIWLACAFSEAYRENIAVKLNELHERLQLGIAAEEMLGVKYGTLAVGIGNIALLAGWIYLLNL